MIRFRPTIEKDAHYLLDIDLKCFDYAWTPEEWREAGKICVAIVATWSDAPIGMVIFGRTPDGDIQVVKVAVKVPFRNRGIARQLISHCLAYAREADAQRVIAIVPESLLRPGEPDDISQWLLRLGFRAEVPLLRDYFYFYGQAEDGVLFSQSARRNCDVQV